MTNPINDPPRIADSASHALREVLRLRDLVPMQILLVVGVTWSGTAARQGGTHVAFWLLGVALFFLPSAAVVSYCVRIWPLEGGVYQWTKHAIGPFAGFMSAWNFGAWAVLLLANLGISTATSLSYAFGPRAAWMADSRAFVMTLDIGLFAAILAINIPGFRLGRWIAHIGTGVLVLVIALLVILLFVHPHTSGGSVHISPQPPFLLAFPTLTLISLNLFSKLTFNGLTGLEQVAVFAGETRDAARSILRSAWVAAPAIGVMYILMSGSMLTYTPADNIDLIGPIPQALATAFSGGSLNGSIEWGTLLGRLAIVALAISVAAAYTVIVAEASRLPMVAAWDHLFPSWFTRLHPRFRTPTRSLTVIVLVSLVFSFLASAGTGTQEAFQLLITANTVCYGVYYLLMFAVPLVAGTRVSPRSDLRPGVFLRAACLSGVAVTLLSMMFNLIPIVDVPHPWLFAIKVALTGLGINLLGAGIYWRGTRLQPVRVDTGSAAGPHRTNSASV
jgi:amino acid transporter